LLSGLTFLVLPQSVFPSSAAQGALGIECLKNRSDNGELLNKLKKMECTDTKDEVKREREKFNAYGGGCHLAVGIHVKKIGPYFLHIHRGVLNDLDVVYTQLEGANRPKLNGPLKTFIGLPNFDDTLIEKLPHVRNLDTSAHYLVSSKYSIPSIDNETEYGSIWASGTKTMMELCKKGIWVHGCADGLGKKEVEHLLDSKAISLMINSTLPLINLTHSDGENALKTYTRKINSVSKEFETKLNEAEIFYWSSYPQYECFVEKYPFIKNKIHAVGIGKTYRQFKHEKIDVLPFYSLEEFNNWAKK
jgi:hydroxymethylbilane synthase